MYIFYITTNIIMLLKKNEINHVYIDIDCMCMVSAILVEKFVMAVILLLKSSKYIT